MLLSIITINRNDAQGLRRTLERVLFKLEKWHVLK